MVVEEPEGQFEIRQAPAPPLVEMPYEITLPKMGDKVVITVSASVWRIDRAVFLRQKDRWIFEVRLGDHGEHWITLAADGSAWIETDELASNV